MSAIKKTTLFFGDVLMLYGSLILTLLIRYGGEDISGYFEVHFWPFSLIFIVWLIVFYVADMYKSSAFRSRGAMFSSLFTSVFISGTASVIIFYIFGAFFELTPKTNLAIFSVIFLVLEYLIRSAFLGLFRSGATNMILLGDSALIKEAAASLKDNAQAGYRIVKWFQNFDSSSLPALSEIVRAGDAQLIVIQPKLVSDSKIISSLYDLLPMGVNLINFSDFYETIFEKIPLEEVGEGWFVEHMAPRRPIYDRTKRLADILFAIIFGIILLPFSAVIAIAIKLSSRGPLIYRQERVGRGGKIFTLFKFRSMTNGHEGPLWTEKNDARVTRIGKIVRFTHLDEIPQLWNVLKGNISIVGPRPEAVGLAQKYSVLPYYEIRHIVSPGLTGWAQTHFRPSASLAEAKEKLCYDIYYAKNRSFVLDLLIILKTLKYFFANHN